MRARMSQLYRQRHRRGGGGGGLYFFRLFVIVIIIVTLTTLLVSAQSPGRSRQPSTRNSRQLASPTPPTTDSAASAWCLTLKTCRACVETVDVDAGLATTAPLSGHHCMWCDGLCRSAYAPASESTSRNTFKSCLQTVTECAAPSVKACTDMSAAEQAETRRIGALTCQNVVRTTSLDTGEPIKDPPKIRVSVQLPPAIVLVEDLHGSEIMPATDLSQTAMTKVHFNATQEFVLRRWNNFTVHVKLSDTIRLMPVFGDTVRSLTNNDNDWIRRRERPKKSLALLSNCRAPLPFRYIISARTKAPMAMMSQVDTIDCTHGTVAERLALNCPLSHGNTVLSANEECCCDELSSAVEQTFWKVPGRTNYRAHMGAKCLKGDTAAQRDFAYCMLGSAKGDCRNALLKLTQCRTKNIGSADTKCVRELKRQKECQEVWKRGIERPACTSKTVLEAASSGARAGTRRDADKQHYAQCGFNLAVAMTLRPVFKDDDWKAFEKIKTGGPGPRPASQCAVQHEARSSLYSVDIAVFDRNGKPIGQPHHETNHVRAANLADGFAGTYLRSEMRVRRFLQLQHDMGIDVDEHMVVHTSGRSKQCLKRYVDDFDTASPAYAQRNSRTWPKFVAQNWAGRMCQEDDNLQPFSAVDTELCDPYAAIVEEVHFEDARTGKPFPLHRRRWRRSPQTLQRPESYLNETRYFRAYKRSGTRFVASIKARDSVLTGAFVPALLAVDTVRIEIVPNAACTEAELVIRIAEVAIDSVTCEGTFGLRLLADHVTEVMHMQFVVRRCPPQDDDKEQAEPIIFRYRIRPDADILTQHGPLASGDVDGDLSSSCVDHEFVEGSYVGCGRCRRMLSSLPTFTVQLQDSLQPLTFLPFSASRPRKERLDVATVTNMFNIQWNLQFVKSATVEEIFFCMIFFGLFLVITNAYVGRGRDARQRPSTISQHICWRLSDYLVCRCLRDKRKFGDSKDRLARIRNSAESGANADYVGTAKNKEGFIEHASRVAKPVSQQRDAIYPHSANLFALATLIVHIFRGIIISFTIMTYIWYWTSVHDLETISTFKTWLNDTKAAQVEWAHDIKAFEVQELKRQQAAMDEQSKLCTSAVSGLARRIADEQKATLAHHAALMDACDMDDIGEVRDKLVVSLAQTKYKAYCDKVDKFRHALTLMWVPVNAFNRFQKTYMSFRVWPLKAIKPITTEKPTIPDVCAAGLEVLARPPLDLTEKSDAAKDTALNLLTVPKERVDGVLMESAFIQIAKPQYSEVFFSFGWLADILRPLLLLMAVGDFVWLILKCWWALSAVMRIINGVEVKIPVASYLLRSYPIYDAADTVKAKHTNVGRLIRTVEPKTVPHGAGKLEQWFQKREARAANNTHSVGDYRALILYAVILYVLSYIPNFFEDLISMKNVEKSSAIDISTQPIHTAVLRGNDIVSHSAFMINKYQVNDMQQNTAARLDWYRVSVRAFNREHKKTLDAYNKAVRVYLAAAHVSPEINTRNCETIHWNGTSMPESASPTFCRPKEITAKMYTKFNLQRERDAMWHALQVYVSALRNLCVRTAVLLVALFAYLLVEKVTQMCMLSLLRSWGTVKTNVYLQYGLHVRADEMGDNFTAGDDDDFNDNVDDTPPSVIKSPPNQPPPSQLQSRTSARPSQRSVTPSRGVGVRAHTSSNSSQRSTISSNHTANTSNSTHTTATINDSTGGGVFNTLRRKRKKHKQKVSSSASSTGGHGDVELPKYTPPSVIKSPPNQPPPSQLQSRTSARPSQRSVTPSRGVPVHAQSDVSPSTSLRGVGASSHISRSPPNQPPPSQLQSRTSARPSQRSVTPSRGVPVHAQSDVRPSTSLRGVGASSHISRSYSKLRADGENTAGEAESTLMKF